MKTLVIDIENTFVSQIKLESMQQLKQIKKKINYKQDFIIIKKDEKIDSSSPDNSAKLDI